MSTASPQPSGGVSTAVLVGVPILFIIVTVVIILLMVLAFLYYRSRQKKNDVDSKGMYSPVPLQEDSGSAPTPRLTSKSLPYGSPPKISMADPHPPNMQFTMATQLSDSTKSSKRYPFMEQHKPPEGRTLRDTRPLKRKKSNHKHGQSRHGTGSLKSGLVDTSSDISDHSSSGGKPEARQTRSKSLTVSATQSETDEMTTWSEIYVNLSYDGDSSKLIVSIDRIVSLPMRADGVPADAYVRLFMIPKLADLSQRKTATTQTRKGQSSPVFKEDICYDKMSREELINSSLHLDVLDYLPHGKHTMLGHTVVHLANVTFVEGEAALKLTLDPPEVRENRGTLNLSICYSPDSKRLSVIILSAKDLNKGNYKETDPQAKLWVTQSGDRVLAKLKTKRKQQSSNPIFNEVLNSTVEPSKISAISINVAITNEHKAAANRSLGQVIICSQSTGEEFRHWNEMLTTPGKPIADWHELR